MPNVPIQPSTQDWGSVNVGRASTKSGTKSGGKASMEKRYGAGGNASVHSGGIMSARKVRDKSFDIDIGFTVPWIFGNIANCQLMYLAYFVYP